MAERLRRLEWVFERSPIYFVTAVTYHRAPILACDVLQNALEAFAEKGPERGPWLGDYVLMPDHLHAFVALDDRSNTLSDCGKSLKNALSKTLRTLGVMAPHWQKGFFDHVLRSAESYEEKWQYVRQNPVRAGLVQGWDDWPWRGCPHPLEYRKW